MSVLNQEQPQEEQGEGGAEVAAPERCPKCIVGVFVHKADTESGKLYGCLNPDCGYGESYPDGPLEFSPQRGAEKVRTTEPYPATPGMAPGAGTGAVNAPQGVTRETPAPAGSLAAREAEAS